MAEPVRGGSILDHLERHAMHERDLRFALLMLKVQLDREGIPFAVIGAVAMQEHGYVRHTEDIDIVTTAEGLDRIHERLIGRGFRPRAEGLRKKLRDTIHAVDIDVIQAGEHAGSAASPVVYPEPTSAAYIVNAESGIAYATLASLIGFKLGSGIWGHRLRDLADVQELIKLNRLDETYAAQLPEALREAFNEHVRLSRLARDSE
jgi:hypothetical protein